MGFLGLLFREDREGHEVEEELQKVEEKEDPQRVQEKEKEHLLRLVLFSVAHDAFVVFPKHCTSWLRKTWEDDSQPLPKLPPFGPPHRGQVLQFFAQWNGAVSRLHDVSTPCSSSPRQFPPLRFRTLRLHHLKRLKGRR